jgi:type II secretory pathway component GspD/PulD (secretin)
MRPRLALGVSLLLGFAPLGAAQETEAFQVRRDGLKLYFAGEVDLQLLLFAAADSVSTSVEFDPAKVTGTVYMQTHVGLRPEEVWDLANRELQARGLATIQPPDSTALRVVPADQAASLARLEGGDLASAKAGYVRVLRPLVHITSDDVLETVRLLLSKPAGTIAATQDKHALLIADYRPQVAQALRALEVLDASLIEPTVVEIPLAHTTPVALGALVDRLVQGRKAVTGLDLGGRALPLAESKSVLVIAPEAELPWWRETIARFDRPEPVSTIHYTPRRFGLADTAKLVEEVVREGAPTESWRLVVDNLTGSLVISTTPRQHERINDLLNRVEATDQAPRNPMRAYAIQHRRVAEVLDLLQGLLDAGVLERGAPPAAPTSTEPADEPVQGATGQLVDQRPVAVGASPDGSEAEVTLVADEATNRIVAFGEGRLLDQLGLLIESLDVRPPQVLVEALVVTLTEDQSRQLGVELAKIGEEDGVLYSAASLFGLGVPDPALGVIPEVAGAGFSGVVLDPGDFSALLRALETVNRGRTLTIPKVLVTNNQQAVLDSTVQTPYASVNATTTVATTSFGGTFDAGTSITVKPQVADADQILLEYTISLSSYSGASTDPNLPPPRQENKLQAVATVPDGSTVVVGGLEIDRETERETRVPWLGSIPLLGNLFKDRTAGTNKARFYVFLRCNVMKGENFEGLRWASQPVMAAAGIHDDWPRLEPRVIR